ncbi:hypothetical protein C2845_PM17G13290 [Panicum miliaceum]|uniref:Rx N-terminal domain-containing protein n=1 Tax=Panicum miliaceum TaxID=4540 RepID=A0A3L6Q1A0_PANMI|nr:hypothetical protein C2845_PM17G13290 [Panicum miliaceum]
MEFAIGLVDVAFKLLSHLRRSYRLSKSKELRRDIKFILRELRSIQDAMRRSSGTGDDRIRCWIADLNEIRKRVEDSVEFHNLKEVANECLAALFNHNFIMPKKVGKFGQVKTFQVIIDEISEHQRQ